tara:strand:- start:1971 stop:2288 length:318 start_codon:yes stop_codon:yes gene_type:complete
MTDDTKPNGIATITGVEIRAEIGQLAPHSRTRVPDRANFRYERTEGLFHSKLTENLTGKIRLINRDDNIYFEFVFDALTGDVLNYCDEALIDHWGQGYAKFGDDK